VKYLSKLTLVFLFGSLGLFAQAPDTAWTRTYGGLDNDRGYSVRQTTDGGYIIAGRTWSFGAGEYDVYLIKTNASGDTLWTRTYGGADSDEGYSVQQTSDGGYIAAGYISSYGSPNVYLIKIKPEGGGIAEKIKTDLFYLFPASPNPFTSITTIRYELTKATNVNVSVYSPLGQIVKNLYSGNQPPGKHSISWNGTGNTEEKLSSGIYFLEFEAGGENTSMKVTLAR
jgi:hypothetical protein